MHRHTPTTRAPAPGIIDNRTPYAAAARSARDGAARIVGVSLRVLGAVAGGYAVIALAVALAGALFARAGMARSEAVVLAAMLGFLAYLALLLWAFHVARVGRLWAGLAGGAAALAGALWLLR